MSDLSKCTACGVAESSSYCTCGVCQSLAAALAAADAALAEGGKP